LTTGSSDPIVLGSGRFVERLLREEEKLIREWTFLKRKKISLETLVAIMSKELDVTGKELTGGGWRRAISAA